MTNTENANGDDPPADTALRQLRALRRCERVNLLNQTKVKRRAREVGLSELVASVDDKRYYELLDRYREAHRSDDATGDE